MAIRVLLLAALCLPATRAHAQKLYHVTDQTSCADCTIRLVRQATLSDTDTGGTLSEGVSMSADRRGRIYVVDHDVTYQMLVFAPDGDFIALIGREGSGPGEYRMMIPPVDAVNGNLHVFDVGLMRRTVLDPSYRFLEIVPLPIMPLPDYALVDSQTFVYNSLARTPQRAGWPLHIERNGTLVSFGTSQPILRGDQVRTQNRRLFVDSDRRIWAAHRTSYVVELWSNDGEMLARYERNVPWFEPWTQVDGPITTHAPKPRITGVWVDDEKRLWVVLNVADPEYRPIENLPGGHGVSLTADHHDQIWATVIEVIDTRTGALIASTRTARNLPFIKNGGLVFEYRESSAGEPLYDIWRPILTETSQER